MNEATEGFESIHVAASRSVKVVLLKLWKGRASPMLSMHYGKILGWLVLIRLELKAMKQASSGNNNSRNPNRSRPSSKVWIHRERKHNRKRNFRTGLGTLGAVGAIHDLILTAEGPGIAERQATSRHDDIDSAAASWAWLSEQSFNRSRLAL